MTQFSISITVNEEKCNWLKEQFKNLFFRGSEISEFRFDFDHNEEYTADYENNVYYYKRGRRDDCIEAVDNSIENKITEYLNENYGEEDDETEEEESNGNEEEGNPQREGEKNKLFNELDRFVELRKSYAQKLERYKQIYEEKMGIFLDSFPNFNMDYNLLSDGKYNLVFSSLETSEDDSDPNYEYVRNPLFLAVFLQMYMEYFSVTTPIKFKYFETSEDAKNRDAGIIIIDFFSINVITLDDIIAIKNWQ